MVNQEFVRQYLSGGPVSGRRFAGLLTEKDQFTEIIGVVANVLKDGLDGRARPEIYLLPGKGRPLDTDFSVMVRTAGDPAAALPMLRTAVRDTDRNAAINEATTLEQSVSRSVSQPKFATLVLTVFAALALILAAIGLYGVLSYNVSQRHREFGVRAALGATPRDLLKLVLREGLTLTLAGLVLGIAGAAAATRLMENLLFGVKPLDTLVYGVAPIVLLAVAAAACALPAHRAASADPAESLRSN